MVWKRLAQRRARRAEQDRNRLVKDQVAALMQAIPLDAVILEIGAGYNPTFRKDGPYTRVYHLDHADAATLRAKYAADPAEAHRIDRIQEVDFVSDGRPIDDVVPPALRFDVIFGSHCLEHQIDLIGHLHSLEKLLKPDGRVIEIIPDLRRCFDMLRYPSVVSDVLLAHMRPSPVHRGKQVFDPLAYQVTLNVGRPLTDAELAQLDFAWPLAEAHQAMLTAERPDATYRDLHAWAFTPESFALLLVDLRLLGLIGLRPRSISPNYENQFCAVLERAPGLDPSSMQALRTERLRLTKHLRLPG